MPSCCRRASRSSFQTTTVVMVPAAMARWRRAKAWPAQRLPSFTIFKPLHGGAVEALVVKPAGELGFLTIRCLGAG